MLKMKKIKSLITLVLVLTISIGFMYIPTLAFEGYVTVNDTQNKYSNLDQAVQAADAIEGTVTYHIYGAVTATGDSSKHTPDTALGGLADRVNIIGETSDAKITLDGVYYQHFAAQNAKLYVYNIILDDDRDCCGEGQDPDPWEFTYLGFECTSVHFSNCSFYEGVLVSVDALFENCDFTIRSEFYRMPNRDFINYTKEQITSTDWASDHYALWISNYGNVTVKDSRFTDIGYGGIKSTWNRYGTNSNLTLTVINTEFTNVGVSGEHAPVHMDGAAAIIVEDCMFVNCGTNDDGGYINCKIQETSITEKDNLENGYYIDYELDGGIAENPLSYDGKAEIALNNPTRAGYIFVGWTNEEIIAPQTTVTIKVGTTGRLYFKANWRKTEIKNEITVEEPQQELQNKSESIKASPKTSDNTVFELMWLLLSIITVALICFFAAFVKQKRKG